MIISSLPIHVARMRDRKDKIRIRNNPPIVKEKISS